MRILAVGKIKETFLSDAVKEYLKRISAYTKLVITEIKETNYKTPELNRKDEASLILKQINPDDFVITLEIDGVMIDSVALANKINQYQVESKNLVFIIGGSTGLDQTVKDRSQLALSFSKMTFPHQLMRVILVEQLYRAFTIINGKEYHK